jgi:hypothetical protein
VKRVDVEKFSELLLAMLRVERNARSITPEAPINAEQIEARWNASKGAELGTVDYRLIGEAVERLRLRGHMIGSTSGKPAGYCLCLTAKEYKEMTRGSVTRALHTLQAFYAPLKAQGTVGQEELFNHPVVQAIVREFDAVRVE